MKNGLFPNLSSMPIGAPVWRISDMVFEESQDGSKRLTPEIILKYEDTRNDLAEQMSKEILRISSYYTDAFTVQTMAKTPSRYGPEEYTTIIIKKKDGRWTYTDTSEPNKLVQRLPTQEDVERLLPGSNAYNPRTVHFEAFKGEPKKFESPDLSNYRPEGKSRPIPPRTKEELEQSKLHDGIIEMKKKFRNFIPPSDKDPAQPTPRTQTRKKPSPDAKVVLEF